MKIRLAAAVVTTCLCGQAAAQPAAAPNLTRQQRDLLQALVTAVDRAAGTPAASDQTWLLHVLRASDGSHYVAFSITPPPDTLPPSSIVLYVRLATATAAGVTTVTERSTVREWLQGSRTDPRMLPRRGMAIGDMPAMGANVTRGGVNSVGSPDLKIMELERERSRQRREDEEKRRREALEGVGASPSDRLPFEDFEIASAAGFADGTRAIQRALTAGPGTYDLFVAWSDAAQPAAKARIHVARRSLQLAPAAATELGLSSIIVADRIGVRETPYTALEQRAHPYTIGPTEIVPARDTVFTPNERLAVAFQLVNPMPSGSGKPDLQVNSRIVRLVGAREEPVASLSPLTYNATTLPADFDVRLGHPVIAAMSVPLASLRRGEYRLLITAEDRLSSTVIAGSTAFTVAGTPAGLLAEAPPLGRRFDRAAALQPAIVAELLDRLAPAASSPGLARAIAAARAGRFVDLLVEDRVPAHEQGVRAMLTGLALVSVGDFGALRQFQRALESGAAAAPDQFLIGVARAMQNRDQDAIDAWEAARSAGLPPAMLSPFLADAYLRRGDPKGAAEAVPAAGSEDDEEWTRVLAATRIATRREGDAIVALDARLARHPGDLDARWLLLHALYADFVNGNGDRRARFLAEAPRYIDAQGPHSALTAEWLGMARQLPAAPP
ncbi:MAG: hypothetical protein Q7R30_02585 [Acidobacteriota bacterium]|nr:hypothetical protein [Acidobacteriota bacterium]